MPPVYMQRVDSVNRNTDSICQSVAVACKDKNVLPPLSYIRTKWKINGRKKCGKRNKVQRISRIEFGGFRKFNSLI
jgi:hypothetical protein